MLIALQTADVQAFVQLVAVAADTAESTGSPWFTDCAHEEVFFTAFFEKSVIGGWELERLARNGEREEEKAREPEGAIPV
jgi:hypothetical protein